MIVIYVINTSTTQGTKLRTYIHDHQTYQSLCFILFYPHSHYIYDWNKLFRRKQTMMHTLCILSLRIPSVVHTGRSLTNCLALYSLNCVWHYKVTVKASYNTQTVVYKITSVSFLLETGCKCVGIAWFQAVNPVNPGKSYRI